MTTPDQMQNGAGSMSSDPQRQSSYSQAYGAVPSGTGHPAHSASAPTASAPMPVAQDAAPKQKTGISGGKVFLIAFAGALIACVLALGCYSAFSAMSGSSTSVNLGGTGERAIEQVDAQSSLAEAVAEKALPSVVNIDVFAEQSSYSGNSILDYLYGYGSGSDDGTETNVSLGSGVILSEDGYIITNYHVVGDGDSYQVTIEGEKHEAEYVGGEASSDIAILKVKDASGFTAIDIADSDNITIGEWVMAIGSPFGLEQSVSTGIVSATSRSQIVDPSMSLMQGGSGETIIYPNMIQTDAAINPGNSGGALVNQQGELIGINTLISSTSGGYSGVGFAIPSNYAVGIAQAIIEGKEPTHAFLGVSLSTINASIAERYGFTVDEGAYVSSVAAGSGAANAGIEVGDIITAVDGQSISSAGDVTLLVRTKQPGDVISITADRKGEEKTFEVTLGETQSNSTSEGSSSQRSSNGGNAQGQGNSGIPGFNFGR